MTKLYGVVAFVCNGAAVALLSLGFLAGASQNTWGDEIPQPTNKCDGNACTDCSWNIQASKCKGGCNVTTNATICKDCECYKYDPNPQQSQCYCTKGAPVAPPPE